MIAFDINGAIIKFDEQRDNYNTIRKIFLEYARKARKEFQEYCDENLTTFRQLNDKYLVFCERLIDEGIKKGVEILVSYNVIVVDFNIFKEKYCEKYFDFKLIFNNFLKEKDAIKNKKNVSRLFDIKPSIDKLSRSIYRDCFNIHMAVIDALLEYNVKDVESYIDIESIKQANALFNNYKDGFISKPDSARIVQKIIMANPYRKDVYEYLIKEDGDFGGEIERLTKYLGYDIRPFKDYLMDVYIQELVQGGITNLELSKEKVSKYAKYIGCDNASLYITRIDAIHTFENA
ncbi:kinase [Intestinibacter bartlettii]|uniref:kinase n=1 Tax=Intestinibacter bartlettii TaxID=261299 RepID=UPI00290433D2|nr:kinase [Intestinibacter bartlettii]MDU2162416.1 kinase [Intestinibacter bartlettii]